MNQNEAKILTRDMGAQHGTVVLNIVKEKSAV